jgi:prevent-host-death family protein
MTRIGVRELRQHASRWLARVAVGETIEITDRGRLVAVLAPAQGDSSVLDRLVASGQLVPAHGELASITPLRARGPRRRSLSRELSELRDEDR